jgi:SEC-C motif
MLPAREKTGRNEPCPCGSGKKYKHCCAMVALGSDDSHWRQQRDASGRLTQEMLKFARSNFAEDIHAAWCDFNQDESPTPLDEDVAEGQIFLPYFLFDWEAARRRGGQSGVGLVARSYLLKAGSRLPELERSILHQATTQPVSFYEVVSCDPGERMVLRDALVGGETEVVERTASKILRPGDLAYGQMCKLPDVVTLGRLAPLGIPPGNKGQIVGLRAWLRRKIAKQNRELTEADLIRYGEEIRSTYLNVRDAMREPPRLVNTDGDPLVLHTLTFRAGSAHAAFEALAPLAKGISKKELLKNAELDDDGALRRVEMPWIKKGNRKFKDWETTILAHIKISGQSLVVEVNSEKRAARIRKEIEKRLGILAIHQRTTTVTSEAMLKKAKRRRTASSSASGAAPDNLSLDPKVKQQAEAEIQRYVESWVHQKIPALGGRTPLVAVKDPDGKEVVEALLLEWERRNEGTAGPGAIRPDINAIRRLLNLDNSIA